MRNSLFRVVTTARARLRAARQDGQREMRCEGAAAETASACLSSGEYEFASRCRHATSPGRAARAKKNAAGWPREYSQTPSDEGNKQL
ncbi:hypothetical protein FCJ57_19480 [Burkholderia diffusa]|nr:hypothetical protein [Burkholderia diffusa]